MWVRLVLAVRTVDLPGNTKAAPFEKTQQLVQQGALSVPVWGSGGPDVNRDPAMEALQYFLQNTILLSKKDIIVVIILKVVIQK